VSRYWEKPGGVPAGGWSLAILVFLGGAAWVFSPALCQAQTTPGYVITTVAGVGPVTNPKNNGFTGDGGPATAAQLNAPMGVALDAADTLYIADQVNNRVRQVPAGGTINTVAGDGTAGYSGDGGAAISAELYGPCGMTVDPSGPFYIADYQNVVRKVTPSEGDEISTVAGTGVYGFGGDGGIGINPGPPGVELAHPCGIALDSNGNLYIADAGNSRIRMINPTGYISTVAGSVAVGFAGDGGLAAYAALNTPESVAVDAANNLYIADTMNNRIRKLTFGTPCNPQTGACPAIITTVAGSGDPLVGGFSGDGGPATAAQLNRPFGVALDSAGNIFFSDSYNQRIRKIDAKGIITTVAGTGVSGFSGDGGPALSATFDFPTGIAVDASGKIYVADTQDNVIRMITPTNCSSAFILGAITAGDFGAMKTVAPGSWMEVYGCDLTPGAAAWNFQGSTAPTSLNGASVTIGGFSANLSYVSPTQVNALIPSEVPVGPQTVYVRSATGASNGFSATSNGFVVNVAQISPGLWAPPELMLGARQYVGALFKDGSGLVLPPGAVLTGDFAGFPSRPALPGDVIVLYGVGFGPVCVTSTSGCVTIPDGQVVQQSNTLQTTMNVIFGGTGGSLADLTYAGLAVNSVGVYEIDLVVPEVPASNVTALSFNLGTTASTQTLYIAVAN
jgi:uncharacterized protein (TIGR03437 family)